MLLLLQALVSQVLVQYQPFDLEPLLLLPSVFQPLFVQVFAQLVLE
jgi:hypothetical protein